jgi:O-antigen/teichoic acid export membrane protein
MIKSHLVPDSFNRAILASVAVHSAAGALLLILQWFLTQMMVVDQFGAYAYAMSWLTVLVLLSNRGLDIAILRFVPEYLSQNRGGLTAGIIHYGSRTTIILGGLLACCILIWAAASLWFIPNNFIIVKTMTAGCLLVPLLGLAKIRFAALKGTGHVIKALLPELIFAPLLIIFGTGLLAAAGYEVDAPTVMLVCILAFLICYGIGNRWLQNTLAKLKLSDRNIQQDKLYWRRTSSLLFVLTGMHVVINNTDIIMLGLLKDHKVAGVYTVCSKSANIIAYTLTVINAIVIPQISGLYFSKQNDKLKLLVAQGLRFVFYMALPICLFFIVGGFFYLGLYGQDFIEGINALRILSIGQTLNALSGPVAYLAALTGHERLTAIIISICALLNVVLNLVLIPIWGLNGAAFSTALTIGMWNIILVIFVCSKLKMNFYRGIFRKA